LFRVSSATRQFTFVDLFPLVNETVQRDSAFLPAAISFDVAGTAVYILSRRTSSGDDIYYENAFALNAETLAVFWLTRVSDPQASYGSAMLDIGNGELMIGTESSVEKLRASDGFSLASNVTINPRRALAPGTAVFWGTYSPFLYNPIQRRGLNLNGVLARSIYGFRPDDFGNAEWLLDGTTYALGGTEWSYGNPVAVDASGRIIIVERGFGLWVFGAYFVHS
jgi:hypothetical protein